MKCINNGCDSNSFVQEQPNIFVKVCMSCRTAQPGRYCPHDTLRCKHKCLADDCYRELEGS